MITASERKLIGLGEFDLLPFGGINHQIYSYSGYGVDSTTSWYTRNFNLGGPVGLKFTLKAAFGMEFYPGSLNVRLIQKKPWLSPKSLNPQKLRLGVFTIATALPVVLNEKCICIAAANNVRGFDPATGEKLHSPLLLDIPEIHQIYSTVNIRERLGLEDKEKSDGVVINARLLSGNLLTVSDLKNNNI